jgi:hypothetical protein
VPHKAAAKTAIEYLVQSVVIERASPDQMPLYAAATKNGATALELGKGIFDPAQIKE